MKRILFLSVNCLLLLFGCGYQRNNEYERMLRSMTIDIPLDSMEYLQPERGLLSFMLHKDKPDFRYVIYFDTATCATCKINRIGIWNAIIKHTKEIGANTDFIFVFAPRHDIIKEFRTKFIERKLNMPIYMDTTGIMERHNPLLSQSSIFHAFVLNDSDHIEVIGDASKSELVERRYYEFLRKKMAEKECSVNH